MSGLDWLRVGVTAWVLMILGFVVMEETTSRAAGFVYIVVILRCAVGAWIGR